MSETEDRQVADFSEEGKKDGMKRLAAARLRAGRVLSVEAIWRICVPALTVVGLFALMGLLRLPQTLPDFLHGLLLVATLLLAGSLLYRGSRGFRKPSVSETDQRIERVSALEHHPLTLLTDRSSGVGSNEVWEIWQERVLSGLGPLRAGWPRLSMPARSGWRFSVLLVPALAAALFLAGPKAGGRLVAAFLPGYDDPDVPMPHVEAWITMPNSVAGSPMFPRPGAEIPPVPEGARLEISVTGLRSFPKWHGSGISQLSSTRLDDSSWRGSAELSASGDVRLTSRGRVIGEWNIAVIPDEAPKVEWGTLAKATDSKKSSRIEWRTPFPFKVSSGRGLADLHVELRPERHFFPGTRREVTLSIPLSGQPTKAEGVYEPDLSADPWAGEKVRAVLVARSISGKIGRSKEIVLTLGQRKFRSPVARAVLDLRKRLALSGEKLSAASEDLLALGEVPGTVRDNTGIFLNLVAIAARLTNEDVLPEEIREEAVARLWDLALDIEDHVQSGAAAAEASVDVRAAQEAVSAQLKHMEQGHAHGQEDQAELKRRMDVLKQAIARRMQALADRALAEHTAVPDMQGFSQNGNEAFSRLMQKLQRDAAEGHSESAEERLRELEDSIERMRNATPQDLAALAQRMKATQQYMEQKKALADLVKQQRQLLDHTQGRVDRKRKSERAATQQTDNDWDLTNLSPDQLMQGLGIPSPSPQDEKSGDKQAADSSSENDQNARKSDRAMQRALARAMDELSDEFHDLTGKDVKAFASAKDAMKHAADALKTADDDAAVTAQRKVLTDLQTGQKEMQQSVKESSSGGPPSFLPSFSSGGSQGAKPRPGAGSADDPDDEDEGQESDEKDKDPLGRTAGEGNDTGDSGSKLPDTYGKQRAHEIEEELRRRDSDRTRSQEELQYLDRLLKSF